MFVEQHQMQMYVYMQKQITPCGWSNKWESIIRWSWSLEARDMYIYKQNDLQKHPLGNREPVHCTLHIFRNKQIVEPFGYNIGCTNQGWTGIGATRTLAGEHGWRVIKDIMTSELMRVTWWQIAIVTDQYLEHLAEAGPCKDEIRHQYFSIRKHNQLVMTICSLQAGNCDFMKPSRVSDHAV